MHIAEGVLTGRSIVATELAGAAVVAWGAVAMRKFAQAQPERKPLLGMAGAFIFLVSLVPIPSFAGTCSHPCGTPLAGILLGPGIGAGLAALALLLQALFFAHGGLTTLGANTITLGLLGAGFGWGSFRLGRKMGMPIWGAAALGGFVGDIATYLGAGLILGGHLAFFAPHPQYSFSGYLRAIYLAYLPVQGPISIGEMVFTAVVVRSVARQRPEVLESLGVERKPSLVAPLVAMLLGIGVLTATPSRAADAPPAGFTGMDESVNMKLAENAGSPARDPFINTEAMGDLWNLILLLGGGTAGFILGRNWHHLFGKRDPALGKTADAAR